jgi:NAD(P)-dependent dehydrogenase (short-subunit alcohol dehydrogenase family)
VVINGRSPERIAEAEAEMRAAGFDVAAVPGSMEDDDTAKRIVDKAIERFGRIDVVINTVGGSRGQFTPMVIDKQVLMDTISLNTWTSLSLVQAAMQAGLADGGGAVVNTSSGTVNKTTPSMVAYAAGKAALNAVTRTLARDLGAQGVRVNGVAPGLTRTSATRGMWEADDGASVGANVVLKRLTQAEDIANAMVFLASVEAAGITGVVIDVDSGNHLMSGWSPITQATSGEGG